MTEILRFAQDDGSEFYYRPSVRCPCNFADEKLRTVVVVLVIAVHEDVVLAVECIYRAAP